MVVTIQIQNDVNTKISSIFYVSFLSLLSFISLILITVLLFTHRNIGNQIRIIKLLHNKEMLGGYNRIQACEIELSNCFK